MDKIYPFIFVTKLDPFIIVNDFPEYYKTTKLTISSMVNATVPRKDFDLAKVAPTYWPKYYVTFK